MPRRRPPRLALAALGLAACFTGGALQGEPCASDADCGTELRCTADRLCGELRCPDSLHTLSLPSFAPQVTILVTYTASMAEALTDDPGTTRWQQVLAFVDALAQALGDRIDLGLQVVPTVGLMNEYQPCRTDARARILPAADQAGAILAALPAAPLNIGEHALRAGLDLSLAGFDLTDPDHLRPRAIVLISDAPLNCSDAAGDPEQTVKLFDNQLIPRVASTARAGVPVFVVGIDIQPGAGGLPRPGATWDQVDAQLAFDALADAGRRPRAGSPRFYRGDEVDALIADLSALPPAFSHCRVTLEDRPAYADLLVLHVGAHDHRVQPDCSSGHGWRWLDPDAPTVLELCPATCAEFRAEQTLTIEPRCLPETSRN